MYLFGHKWLRETRYEQDSHNHLLRYTGLRYKVGSKLPYDFIHAVGRGVVFLQSPCRGPKFERPFHMVARWQNLIISFPWIAPGWRAWGRNPIQYTPESSWELWSGSLIWDHFQQVNHSIAYPDPISGSRCRTLYTVRGRWRCRLSALWGRSTKPKYWWLQLCNTKGWKGGDAVQVRPSHLVWVIGIRIIETGGPCGGF